MQKPVIGILCGIADKKTYLYTGRSHADAVIASGGLPVYLAITKDENILQQYLELCHGFIFTGGPDIDPFFYGEEQRKYCGPVQPERDESELALARMLIHEPSKAVLGICRGNQLLNVAAGGTLYQDLSSQYEVEPIAHQQKQNEEYLSHTVSVSEHSLLETICGNNRFRVCSLHHQAVKKPGQDMAVCAHASDGVIEGICHTKHPFFLGVQWHPERTWKTDPISLNVFRGLVLAAQNLSTQLES